MSFQKGLTAALSGIVAGVAIGLLVAPMSGKETRQKITDTTDDLKKKYKKLRGLASDELDELRSIFENESEGLREDVRQRVLNLIGSTKRSYNNAKNQAANEGLS